MTLIAAWGRGLPQEVALGPCPRVKFGAGAGDAGFRALAKSAIDDFMRRNPSAAWYDGLAMQPKESIDGRKRQPPNPAEEPA